MVSDWQGGDISKLFPALSGKEDLSMGEDKKADKKRQRIVQKAPVQMIISREYVGTQTVTCLLYTSTGRCTTGKTAAWCARISTPPPKPA